MRSSLVFICMDKEVAKLDIALPDQVDLCHEMIRQLASALKSEKSLRENAEARIDQLLRRLYGPKSERVDPNQPGLFDGIAGFELQTGSTASPEVEIAHPETAATARKRQDKSHGRNKLSPNLPRKRIVHDLPEAAKACPGCHQPRKLIGEDVREKLDYIPSSVFVAQHVRLKYACVSCLARLEDSKIATIGGLENQPEDPAVSELIVTAPMPEMVIPKGIPGAGLLAHVAVSKYFDHLPLHRQVAILARSCATITRSTLCDWMSQLALALTPLYLWLIEDVKRSLVLHCDETTVPVQQPGSGKTKTGRLWILVGDEAHRHTVFRYTPTKNRDGPKDLLNGYQGYLQADAANLFDGLYLPGGIIEVGCWAHGRRHFYEARTSDAVRACEAMARIRQMYAVEEEAKGIIEANGMSGAEAAEVRLRLRQDKTVPMLKELEMWLREQQKQVLPKSPVGKAVQYALNHWTALNRFTENGYLDIDNNEAERGFRGAAIGRRNWLFAGSDNGGETAAILYSFMESCRLLKIDPFTYLRDLLENLPRIPAEQLGEWAPANWAKTRKPIPVP